MAPIEVDTPRLRLRRWRAGDREPFAALNADARVMEFFPAPLSRLESDALAGRIEASFDAQGWGLWAVESQASGEFIGCVGLAVPRADLPFSPCVEIGWRLAYEHWGQGLASEAARGALTIGFETLGLTEIVSFTARINRRSRAVMERIGMVDAGEDFDHPALAEDSALRRHCLYRIARQAWAERPRPRAGQCA
ncbi:MAG: GNAT family N-acetyltransferase [Burkholderiaceae bacterium]